MNHDISSIKKLNDISHDTVLHLAILLVFQYLIKSLSEKTPPINILKLKSANILNVECVLGACPGDLFGWMRAPLVLQPKI